MLRRVALVGTDISEELNASIIRATRIGKLGKTLASNNKDQRVPPQIYGRVIYIVIKHIH
jgi:hypothetical protein